MLGPSWCVINNKHKCFPEYFLKLYLNELSWKLTCSRNFLEWNLHLSVLWSILLIYRSTTSVFTSIIYIHNVFKTYSHLFLCLCNLVFFPLRWTFYFSFSKEYKNSINLNCGISPKSQLLNTHWILLYYIPLICLFWWAFFTWSTKRSIHISTSPNWAIFLLLH